MKGEKFLLSQKLASDEDGGGRKDHLEGGRGENRCVLPAHQTHLKTGHRKRRERILSMEMRWQRC
jgi:hypothetical protein